MTTGTFPGAPATPNLSQALTGAIAAARNPTTVIRPESRTRVSREAQIRHLNTTFDAHQKFATLSSKIPRSKGNIRMMGPSIAENGAKGGRKGRKKIKKDNTVTSARRASSLRL